MAENPKEARNDPDAGDVFFHQQIESFRLRIDRLLQQEVIDAARENPLFWQALEELQGLLEEMLVAREELRVANEDLLSMGQAIEAERRRYRELFEFAPDGYLVTDAQGKILAANRAAARLLSIPPENLVGKPLSVYVHEDVRRDLRLRLLQLAQPGAPALGSTDEAQQWETRLLPRKGEPSGLS